MDGSPETGNRNVRAMTGCTSPARTCRYDERSKRKNRKTRRRGIFRLGGKDAQGYAEKLGGSEKKNTVAAIDTTSVLLIKTSGGLEYQLPSALSLQTT